MEPLKSLLHQGFSKTTLARVAYLRIPQLRQWEQEMIFPADTALVRIKALDSVLRELWKMDLPFDPVAFYEAHMVLLERDGIPYSAKLSHFFEANKWKHSDIVNYAESLDSILTQEDIEEQYPSSYKVVTASDGAKAIVPVRGVKPITAQDLVQNWNEYSLIN